MIADRFVIDGFAGSGGMGTVYRALDRQGGGVVALKLCRVGAAAQVTRFEREIRALATVRHPGIVAHVADGHTADGQPFLAMEWLAGEDLARRLARGPLAPADALMLAERLAAALGAAHGLGIVHRDLKPSNVFLRGGVVGDAVVLDFGIARLGGGTYGATLTATGSLLGTPEYMAPEQARGDRDVGPAADLFSLGSLLFECLTGRTPFASDRMMAVLAKIVFEEAPRLTSVWPEAPAPLCDLIARLLAKEPAGRPGSAAELQAELMGLRGLSFGAGPTLTVAPALQGPELQILSVVLVAPPGLPEGPLAGLLRSFAQHDGRATPLADGSLAVAFGQTGHAAATDRAAQAARCALLLKEQAPGARIAVATGRGVLRGGAPCGSALERAAELLDATPTPGMRLDGEPPIWIDEVTAGLIEAGFVLRELPGRRRQLLAELATLDPTRPLLGKPTPCVGRDLDLAALAAALASAIDEPGARVAVVRAPPGMGKSRLRHEFLRRAAAQHPDVAVYVGRCDPMSAGSSQGLLAQVVRGLCGAPEGAAPEELRRLLGAWAGQHLPASEAARTAGFLGELCGAPFPDEQHPALRSARQDAAVMAEQVTGAFAACLRAACETRPLLLVLEDLHWGDKATVRLVGAALRGLVDLPFLVLALARPEIDDLFPRLWEEYGPTNLTLRALGRRPCERLCRGVLGPAVSDATIDRIVEQSGGNALFLEELIRAVAEGKGEALPESVLAMLQARLMRLAPDARRVLRAASVFGETFTCDGVRALLGSSPHDGADVWLAALVEAELVVRDLDGGPGGEALYRFRHALMRDAAYSMLAEDDRALAHRAAGRFLEAAGECDPMVLARHYELGQEGTRAGECYARAAEAAHFQGDAAAVIARAEQAIAHPLPGHTRPRMLALISEELGWQLDFRSAGTIAAEVVRTTEPGSAPWCVAVAARIFDLFLHGHQEAAAALLGEMYTAVPEPGSLAKLAFSLFAAMYWLYLDGQPQAATRLLARLRELTLPVAADEPLAYSWYCLGHTYLDSIGAPGPASCLEYGRRCNELFQSFQHRRGQLLADISIGRCLWLLGRHAEAEAVLERCVAPGVDVGPIEGERVAAIVELMAAQGRTEEAIARAEAKLANMHRRNATEMLFEGAVRSALATALRSRGELARAEEEARTACTIASPAVGVLLTARCELAAVLLARGRAAEAAPLARECIELYAARGYHGPREHRAHLLAAEALMALGERDAARAAIVRAREAVLERAGRIDDEALRRGYLADDGDHVRILALADEWTASAT